MTGAASLACALLLVFSVIGIRQDFADMAVRMPFAFKLAYTGVLVVGSSVVALYAATPGASATALYALSPAVILLTLGVIFDPTAFPIMGRTNTAVAFCMGHILFLSLPAMILIFVVVMRKGASTRPLFAGAVIGMLSASLGAMAYTLACKNDGTAFVAIWYGVACAIMAAIGAIVGRRVLRW
ncbi:NrsF family protein [Bradyrhizobium genosp. P]|uniref:NrsF family protein n=1 Tax=Bradyrhizobium genosp. P TaxID=83641 RepID=UPI003CEF6716